MKTNELSTRLTAVTLNERVLERLRTEIARRKTSQRDIAGFVDWTQSKVAQKMNGRTPITLDELESLCFAVGLSPVEAVRDHGLEFCAEMKPSELRILERIRQLDHATLEAITHLLRVAPNTRIEERRAARSIRSRTKK